VYVAGRDSTKANAAIEELQALTQKTAKFLLLDLSDLKSVKAAAEEFAQKETELHVLFNNAAVMTPPVEELTRDRYDLQFGTNALGKWWVFLFPVFVFLTQCRSFLSYETLAADTSLDCKVITSRNSSHRKRFFYRRISRQSRLQYFQRRACEKKAQ
jgi:retinol dehydrogenase 12